MNGFALGVGLKRRLRTTRKGLLIFKTAYIFFVLFDYLGSDTVVVGGHGNVRLPRTDFKFATAAHKPTSMTLRLVDALFSKETLVSSTVHGTKDYAPLDQEIIAAIKGILNDSYNIQYKWNYSFETGEILNV